MRPCCRPSRRSTSAAMASEDSALTTTIIFMMVFTGSSPDSGRRHSGRAHSERSNPTPPRELRAGGVSFATLTPSASWWDDDRGLLYVRLVAGISDRKASPRVRRLLHRPDDEALRCRADEVKGVASDE